MKRAVVALVVLGVTCMALAYSRMLPAYAKASDRYVRSQVVTLRGENGLCSGVVVHGPSGRSYVLSAGHCADIAVGGLMPAYTEEGVRKVLTVVKVDANRDLMLLRGIEDTGVPIADKYAIHDSVRIIAHGKGHAAYTSEGEMLEEDIVPILDQDVHHVFLVVFTSARAIGGCSSGPAVDSAGKLIGIVSVTDGFFSGVVPLKVIHSFMVGT